MLAAKPSPQPALPPRVIVLIAVAATALSLSMGTRQSLGLFVRPINPPDAHKALKVRATSGSTILTIEPSIHRSLP